MVRLNGEHRENLKRKCDWGMSDGYEKSTSRWRREYRNVRGKYLRSPVGCLIASAQLGHTRWRGQSCRERHDGQRQRAIVSNCGRHQKQLSTGSRVRIKFGQDPLIQLGFNAEFPQPPSSILWKTKEVGCTFHLRVYPGHFSSTYGWLSNQVYSFY